MSTAPLLYEKRDQIAYITFNRPEKVNAMNGEVYRLLEEAIEDYAADENLRCAIISGAGGNFSSGGDLNWFRQQRENAKAEGKRYNYDFPAYRAMDRLRKPVIAAVDGYCLASGFNCALLFCDIRIASDRAQFGNPAVKRGLSGGGNDSTYAMPWLNYIGLGNALYMTLTAKFVDAQQALTFGIVSEVVPADQLMQRATEIAQMICENSPVHVQHNKEFLRRSAEVPGSFIFRLQHMVMRPVAEAGYNEGTSAFLEKRAAAW